MGKNVALLDVDHTLLFDVELNVELLDTLKEQGVNDIYLFTDMTMNDSGIQDRQNLISDLEKRGFDVHGVITPVDLAWDLVPEKKAFDFYNKKLREYSGKKCVGDDFDNFLRSKSVTQDYDFVIPALDRAMEDVECGIAFKEAQKALGGNINADRSRVAKLLADHKAERNGYSHTKGMLLGAFIKNKPGWVSNIIIADDNDHVIQSINQYKEKNRPTIPICAITVKKDNSMKQADYNKIIQEDTSYPYIVREKMVQEIDEHIRHLKRSNIFLSSPKAKITAFETLKTNLIKADLSKTDVQQVIEQWEKNKSTFKNKKNECVDIKQVLSQHRNPFKSEYRTKEASSQEIVRHFKEIIENGRKKSSPPLENELQISPA